MNHEEQSEKIKGSENTHKALTVPAEPVDLSDADLEQVVGGDSIDSGHEGG